MKLSIIPALATSAALSLSAYATAAVPSLINYQGRLTDNNGDPVTGTKNFILTIFDAATAGNMLYTENIGAVTLDAKGIYQFQFGNAGTSNTSVTETVGTTDGTATTYQKILTNEPIVENSLSVTDGTYTWSQTDGSSDSTFSIFYNSGNRQVTAIYSTTPAEGRTITASYRYETGGISGALSSAGEQWMAINVDGTEQGIRQRVLAVPFANRAEFAKTAESVSSFDEEILNLSTSSISTILDEIALSASTHNSSYVCDVYTSEEGLRKITPRDQLWMSWDDSKNVMTTRNFERKSGVVTSLNKTWSINRYVSVITFSKHDLGAVRFSYRDGTSSIANSSYPIMANPHVEKVVNSINITKSWSVSTKEWVFLPTYLPSKTQIVIQVTDIPNEVYALRVLAEGSFTGSLTFKNSLEWRIQYSDDSFSNYTPLYQSAEIDKTKTVSGVIITPASAVLESDGIDISKILVRKITK